MIVVRRFLFLPFLIITMNAFASGVALDLPPRDSTKTGTLTKVPVVTKAQRKEIKKAEQGAPVIVDMSKKTMRLKFFGNTFDFDFKNKAFDVNRDQKQTDF